MQAANPSMIGRHMAKHSLNRWQPPPKKSEAQLLDDLAIARADLAKSLSALRPERDSSCVRVLTDMLSVRTILRDLLDIRRSQAASHTAKNPKIGKARHRAMRQRSSRAETEDHGSSVFIMNTGQKRKKGSHRSQA